MAFPLLDLIGSLHTALLFIRSEKFPEPYHGSGSESRRSQNSNFNNYRVILTPMRCTRCTVNVAPLPPFVEAASRARIDVRQFTVDQIQRAFCIRVIQ